MTLDHELRENHSELIGDWDRIKKSSWHAKSLILEVYNEYGYVAAVMAIKATTAQADAIRNREYEKKWRAE